MPYTVTIDAKPDENGNVVVTLAGVEKKYKVSNGTVQADSPDEATRLDNVLNAVSNPDHIKDSAASSTSTKEI